MSNIIDFETVKKELNRVKAQNTFKNFGDGISKVADFCGENSELIGIVIGAGTLASKLIKSHNRKMQAKYELEAKELKVWDPSKGCYYPLKRKMKANELVEFETRKSKGELTGAILSSMNLLDCH